MTYNQHRYLLLCFFHSFYFCSWSILWQVSTGLSPIFCILCSFSSSGYSFFHFFITFHFSSSYDSSLQTIAAQCMYQLRNLPLCYYSYWVSFLSYSGQYFSIFTSSFHYTFILLHHKHVPKLFKCLFSFFWLLSISLAYNTTKLHIKYLVNLLVYPVCKSFHLFKCSLSQTNADCERE